MGWWLLWWVWVAVAVGFGILEVLLPVFAFLGFSVGALGTALLVGLGVDLGLGGTVLFFALLSGVAYGVLRLALGAAGGRERVVRGDINDNPPR